METTFGVLCLIPPVLAIVLALITKQTILSLLIATWVGSTIINGWNPLVGFVKIISDYVIPSISGNASGHPVRRPDRHAAYHRRGGGLRHPGDQGD